MPFTGMFIPEGERENNEHGEKERTATGLSRALTLATGRTESGRTLVEVKILSTKQRPHNSCYDLPCGQLIFEKYKQPSFITNVLDFNNPLSVNLSLKLLKLNFAKYIN